MAEAPVPAAAAQAVERRIVSVLFADLVGFTTLSEQLDAEDVADAIIPMGNPHFFAAVETVVRAWLDAGRAEPAAVATERSAADAAEPGATDMMRVSAALLNAWAGSSAESARRAADLSAALGAPWWELRALRALGDPRADVIEATLGI